MGNEASKTKQIWGEFEKNLLKGEGIDIGCGPDPIMPNAIPFDMEDGDANEISKYIDKQFDFVFSSHSLEHMHDPIEAIQEWWKLVKPGGHLIFVVPDEDLYEQGYFPSLFNEDHKSTFTISKNTSWSPRSYNILELITYLRDAQLLKIELQDNDYKRNNLYHSVYSRENAYRGMSIVRKISSLFKVFGIRKSVNKFLCQVFRLPIDQTNDEATAQISVIIKKTHL